MRDLNGEAAFEHEKEVICLFMLVPDKRPFCLCNHEVVTVERTNSPRLEVLREKGKLLCEVDALHWREPSVKVVRLQTWFDLSSRDAHLRRPTGC